jgi:hypothetical protein
MIGATIECKFIFRPQTTVPAPTRCSVAVVKEFSVTMKSVHAGVTAMVMAPANVHPVFVTMVHAPLFAKFLTRSTQLSPATGVLSAAITEATVGSVTLAAPAGLPVRSSSTNADPPMMLAAVAVNETALIDSLLVV